MHRNFRKLLLCATALTAYDLTMSQSAMAQEAATAAAEEAVDAGEITVTARRRDESIVDVPLAITVVSAAQIERLGLKSTRDIANFVPGPRYRLH